MASQSASSTTAEMAGQAGQWLQGMRDAAMSMATREKKDEDEAYSPFAGLQKAAVLQEGRCFNDREINPRKCIGILTLPGIAIIAILLLLRIGHSSSSQPAYKSTNHLNS